MLPGSGEAFNVGQFLEESSPYLWASTGIGLCIGFSVLGAGWCEYHTIITRLCSLHLIVCFCFTLGAFSSLVRPSSVVVSEPPAYGPRTSSGLHRHLPFLGAHPAKMLAYSIIFCEVVAIYGVVRPPCPFSAFSSQFFLSDNRDCILGKARPHRGKPALHTGEPFHWFVSRLSL